MIEVVCAVIIAEGRVLLCQRGEGRHLAGYWEFPGGKVEEGEDFQEALKREIREELGCGVEVKAPFLPVEHTYPDTDKVIRLWPFFCVVTEGTVSALEHADLAWVERSDLARFVLASADVKLAEQVVASWERMEFGEGGRETLPSFGQS